MNHTLPNSNIGIVIANAKTGKIIYQKNAYQPFTPASNTKLFTAAAALYLLGPNYTYNTTLKTANSNYYLTFSGDPSFTAKDLQAFFEKLKKWMKEFF